MAICLSKGDIPPAKSVAQRLLIIQYLANNLPLVLDQGVAGARLSIAGYFGDLALAPQLSDDTVYLWQALQRLMVVEPDSEIPVLDCGAGGTTLRFLVALAAVLKRPLELIGCQRLGQRPLEPLLNQLSELGLDWRWSGQQIGCWPLQLRPQEANQVDLVGPKIISIDCRHSSQFLSALLLVAPYLSGGLILQPLGPVVSWSYVEMTINLMAEFGGKVRISGNKQIIVEPGTYISRDYRLPGDWSAAAFILAAGWLTGQEVRFVDDLPQGGQGDSCFPMLLAQMVAGAAEFDLSSCPDLLPVLTGCAIFLPHGTTFVGIAHTELKESPRASLLVAELGRIGADLHYHDGRLTVNPASLHGAVTFDPHGDHRLAMTMALISLRLPNITVSDRQCVSKSFPRFFQLLRHFEAV